MSNALDLGPLFAALPDAVADIKANAPLPPPPDMSMSDIASGLTAAEGYIAEANALIAAYPGVLTGLGRLLASQTAPWAISAQAVLAALPGGLAAAAKYGPDISFALTEFAPAPQPIDEPPAR